MNRILVPLAALQLFTLGCMPGVQPAASPVGDGPVPPKNEIVMSPGMTITATTPTGAITVTAGRGLKRSYTWEGATRSVEMWPRGERWYGSLGLYYPGPGNHWEAHNGITRGGLQEGSSISNRSTKHSNGLQSKSSGCRLSMGMTAWPSDGAKFPHGSNSTWTCGSFTSTGRNRLSCLGAKTKRSSSNQPKN